MVTLNPLSRLSAGERNRVITGTIAALLISGYFFVIEPLNQQTLKQQQITDTRLEQLSKMQTMASDLLSHQHNNSQTAQQLLGTHIAGETLENGLRVIKTHALSAAEGKRLLRQLAPLGKVELYPSQTSVEVWFWTK